nr:MAG TPA: hypothetical protein [Caudoviricetes sp.]
MTSQNYHLLLYNTQTQIYFCGLYRNNRYFFLLTNYIY